MRWRFDRMVGTLRHSGIAARRCRDVNMFRRTVGSDAIGRREPLLFTPGPLTTSLAVKQAMLVDIGSRDNKMISVVQEIRSELLEMAGVSKEAGFECVLMQGSGTFAVEGIVSSVVPPDGKLLVVSNGAYGLRMGAMASVHGIEHSVLKYAEDEVPCPIAVAEAVKDGGYTHVGVIHHETTAGVLNPVDEIGAYCHAAVTSGETNWGIDLRPASRSWPDLLDRCSRIWKLCRRCGD